MKKEIESGDRFVIFGFMVTDLKLKGNLLIIYAFLFDYCNHNSPPLQDAVNYLVKFVSADEKKVRDIINILVSRKLVSIVPSCEESGCDSIIKMSY